MKPNQLLILISTFYFVACSKGTPVSTSVNQISVTANGQLEITGTSSGISSLAHIKSPFILLLDKELKAIRQKTFTTETTALNPKLLSTGEGNILSFYKAKSLVDPTEQSHILQLDDKYQLQDKYIYGWRTRIKKLISKDNHTYLSYNYERSTRTVSLSDIIRMKKRITNNFSIKGETNIPTDIILINDSIIVATGIVNGYSYNDGHDYNNKLTFGYLLKINTATQDTFAKHFTDLQNLSINDIEYRDPNFITTGTVQQKDSGMDLHIMEINSSLQTTAQLKLSLPGTQQGIKTIAYDSSLITLAKSDNSKDRKMKILLIQNNKLGQVIWQQTFGDQNYSYDPKDFLVYKDLIYIIADRKPERQAISESVLLTVSLSGKLIQSIPLSLIS